MSKPSEPEANIYRTRFYFYLARQTGRNTEDMKLRVVKYIRFTNEILSKTPTSG
jgi:hypothetical protein